MIGQRPVPSPDRDGLPLETEAERVEAWKLEQLLHRDVPVRDAEKIAARSDIDWHEAERLINAGCPPQLVAAILA